MTALDLARLQFGITTVYHFFFVPITIGLAVLIAILETIYVRTGREEYKRLAQFWGRLFLINFAVGVVTGILQEFQFGMNWAGYSRFVGDIFGAPLAIEALLAFFLESTFIGIWQFGWEQVSKRVHLFSIWMVALGTTLSAFWILTANSFMQEPVGYALQGGKAVMTDFLALVKNPQLWVEFPHTIFAAYLSGAMFMLGISAYQILRGRDVELFKKSFRVAAITAFVASVGVIGVGHLQADHLATSQPLKYAAAEAIWKTTPDPAPLSLIGVVHEDRHTVSPDISIPYLLSLMTYYRPSGAVTGLDELQAQYAAKYGPGDYVPPVAPTYYSFRVMVFAGVAMLALAAYATWLLRGGRFATRRRFLKVLVWAIALPYLANTAGWIMTEVGRQPWVVYGLLSTARAVSPTVTPAEVWTSLGSFTLIYTALAAAAVYLFKRAIDLGAAPMAQRAAVPGEVASYVDVAM
ncbi:MAG: cytochrome ubiquinol oxidase subunit I [Firmicutes bacterium]|nr:cytochrome ubiquinol oxidase subunit I [Bacillota bacterium]